MLQKPKIDVLLAGSANDHFFSNIAFLRLSLDQLGGPYKEARVVAALAEWETPTVPARWAHYLNNVEIVWTNAENLPNATFDIQHYARFEHIRPDADIVIACDADICFMQPFEELLETVILQDVLAGVIAHYHFPIKGVRGNPKEDWPAVAQATLGRSIHTPFQYMFGRCPNDSDVTTASQFRPKAPFYINYGFLIGRPETILRMQERERELLPKARSVVAPWFGAQVCVALACADLGLNTLSLPLRYNYPNRPEAEILHPNELSKAVIFHYMFEENFRRSEVFADQAAFDEFMTKSVSGADHKFQSYIADLTDRIYPFS